MSCSHENHCVLVDGGAAGGKHQRWQSLGGFTTHRFDPNLDVLSKAGQEILHPYALSMTGKDIEIRIARKSETSSRYSPNADFLRRFKDAQRFETVRTAIVESVTLDSVLGESNWFAKLDVQGMELDVIRGATSSLANALGLEVEVEFSEVYSGQPLSHDVFSLLHEAGLEFIDFLSTHNWVRSGGEGPGQLVFADALFLRSPESVASLGDLCVSKFYLALLLAYGRIDLATRLVELEPALNSTRLRRLLTSLRIRFRYQVLIVSAANYLSRPALRNTTVRLLK